MTLQPSPEVLAALEKIETALRFQRNNIEPTGDEGVEYMLALMTLRAALASQAQPEQPKQDSVHLTSDAVVCTAPGEGHGCVVHGLAHPCEDCAAELSRDDVAQEIRKVLDAQGAHGNWNYDNYMHGLFNGLEMASAIAEGRDPAFRKAPDRWIGNIPMLVGIETVAGCGADNASLVSNEKEESVAALPVQPSIEERLKVQSGPFKGKPQVWFTRAEVIALLTGISDTMPEIIRILADWEDANGCLAAIMYDEWIALYKPITEAAVAQSPRMIRNEWQARLPAAVKDSLTTRPDDGVYSALTLASFAIKCLRDGIDIGEKLPDILQRIDAMLALRARPAEPTPSVDVLRQTPYGPAQRMDVLMDAERYRWLRDSPYEDGAAAGYRRADTIYLRHLHGEELDAAIDKELSKEKP